MAWATCRSASHSRSPTFDFLAPPSYPVQLSVPAPGRLNRWAVAFRIILLIPAYRLRPEANTLLAQVRRAGEAYLSVSGAPSVAAFEAEVRRDHLAQLSLAIQHDYSALHHRL